MSCSVTVRIASQGEIADDGLCPFRPFDLGPRLRCAVKAAPANHKVLFENDRLRVLEVTLGQTAHSRFAPRTNRLALAGD
jgi:hypothetical protein